MLDRVPGPLREPLWRAKHRLVRWLQDRALAEAPDAWLAKQLAAKRIEVVLDVGANRGQYARLLRRVGYRGRIVSFEPIAALATALAAEAARDPAWTVHRLALGDADGELELNVAELDVFSSLLAPAAAGPALFGDEPRVARVERVEVRRLDGLLPGLVPAESWPRVHLKLDTQGYDLRVLHGLGAALASLTSLQTELSLIRLYDGQPDYLEVLAFLKAAGLEPTGFFPVTRDPRTLRVVEYDAFLCRG